MKERPISFSPPMIRAILGGAKTQTRRVVNPQPPATGANGGPIREVGLTMLPASAGFDARYFGDNPRYIGACPYGVPGDYLYVKEGSWIWCKKQPNGTTPKGRPKFRYVPVGRHVVYRADGAKPTERIDADPSHQWRLKVARFMPKWAARLTLEIAGVRVERVKSISEADAKAEGVRGFVEDGCFVYEDYELGTGTWQMSARGSFASLWNSINGKSEGCAWGYSPWVWVVSFKRVTAEARP